MLKRDTCPTRQISGWHVFESVFRKHEHHHNYTPGARSFLFRAGGRTFEVQGFPYCQQNGLNKACAQVAIRSVALAHLADQDLSFRAINDHAYAAGETREPWTGLSSNQLARALRGLGIRFFDINYDAADPGLREKLTYQRLLYSGIECGAGALLAFKMSGPKADPIGHVIPVFGHTFNADSWAPHADGDYFNIGKTIRYIPSDAWMSSFIVHDDNYGSNLCIPKSYIHRDNAAYTVALVPAPFVYPGLLAEFAASTYFYSLLPNLHGSNPWLRRLMDLVAAQKLILRVVPVSKERYLRHLDEIDDWEGRRENEATRQTLTAINPPHMWMVEVSVPDLFSTNKRKIGELLLDGTREFTPKADFTLFVLARFPGCEGSPKSSQVGSIQKQPL